MSFREFTFLTQHNLFLSSANDNQHITPDAGGKVPIIVLL